MVILRLCLLASLLFCLIKSQREENIGRRRRGRRNEQIYLGINRFGSAIQQSSAAFSASLLPSVRRAQKSDWKVSLWACSILGKNLKKKNPKPKQIPWNKKIMLVKWSVLYPCPVSKQSLPSRGAVLCPPWLPDPRIRLKRSGLSSFFPFPLPIPALIFFFQLKQSKWFFEPISMREKKPICLQHYHLHRQPWGLCKSFEWVYLK